MKSSILSILAFLAVLGISGKSSFLFAAAAEEEEAHPNTWCHCEATTGGGAPFELHCEGDKVGAEPYCECHEHDGEIEVECQAIDSSCHCEDDALHCSSEPAEAMAKSVCLCHHGAMECIGDEEEDVVAGNAVEDEPSKWCHCEAAAGNLFELHCAENRTAAESYCECHEHDGEIEVECQAIDSSCHCEDEDLHCSSESAEAMAGSICKCHHGTLECIGDEEEETVNTVVEVHPNKWCHCEAEGNLFELHCEANKTAAESYCECHEHDGEIEVECQAVDSSCHCEGDDLHCSSESAETMAGSICKCHDGAMECIGDEEKVDEPSKWCQCEAEGNGFHLHCLADKSAAESYCECHEHDGEAELECQAVDSSCHCEGDDALHCSSESAEAMAKSICKCHDGALECIGDEESKDGATKNLDQDDDDDKPWSQVILTALLVNLVTLAGLAIVAGDWIRRVMFPGKSPSDRLVQGWTYNLIPMFAAGAVLATAFFLVLPEALHMIQSEFSSGDGDGHDGHNHRFLREKNAATQSTWRWGASILGGIMLPYFSHFFFHKDHNHDDETMHDHSHVNSTRAPEVPHSSLEGDNGAGQKHEQTRELSASISSPVDGDSAEGQRQEQPAPDASTPLDDEDEIKKPQQEEQAPEKPKQRNFALLISLSVADFFHQFADGVFIGTAWNLCDRDVALTIAMTTVFHELPHQIADYFLMVNYCGLEKWKALVLNFVVGLGTLLGAILVTGFDLSNLAIGVILAIGGGTFAQVGIAETLSRAEKYQVTPAQKGFGFLAFLLGAIPIGLVLLDHEHCGGH